MARIEMSGLDETIESMKRLGEMTGETAREMLLAGAEEVKLAWQAAAQDHGLKDTGDMIASIGYQKKPKSVEGVLTLDIYPRGKDRRGVRNAEKAFINHFGSSSIEATHWVDDASEYGEEKATAAMISVWDQFIATRY